MGAAQRPDVHINVPKKTGTQSARTQSARTQIMSETHKDGQNNHLPPSPPPLSFLSGQRIVGRPKTIKQTFIINKGWSTLEIKYCTCERDIQNPEFVAVKTYNVM